MKGNRLSVTPIDQIDRWDRISGLVVHESPPQPPYHRWDLIDLSDQSILLNIY